MIKSFKVTNYVGDSITLELTRPDKTGFIVKSVDGLGPVKATVNMTQIATNDGARFNSARLDKRNIVFDLEFMELPVRKDENGDVLPYETIEDIRHKSYKFFPLKKKIKLVVETDKRIVETEGYVESNEPDIFSNKEGCRISILCPDSFFYSLGSTETVFSGLKPMLEFPFGNESTTEPLIEMSRIETKQEHYVYYEGDVEVGVTILVHAVGEASNLNIYNATTEEHMRIDTEKLAQITGSGIIPGDTIIIETRKGCKKIRLLREGKEINILNCLDKGTKWFTLVKGDNVFVYTTDEGGSNLQFSVTNKVVYEGV